MNQKYNAVIPGATMLTLEVDARFQTEQNHDYLQIFLKRSGKEELVERLEGTYADLKLPQLPGSGTKFLQVTGSEVDFRFTSDSSNEYWGFKITVKGEVWTRDAAADEDTKEERRELEEVLQPVLPGKAEVAVMDYVVRQCFKEADIRARNAHCACDMLELAVTNKNHRMMKARADGGSLEAAQALVAIDVLTPQDFGVEMLSRDELQRRRDALAEEVRGLVGWGGAAQPESPKGFLEKARQMLLMQAQADLASSGTAGRAGASHNAMRRGVAHDAVSGASASPGAPIGGALPPNTPRKREMGGRMSPNWNLVVTGSVGSGKSTFADVAQRHLRAYGALTKDHVTCLSGAQLKAEGGKCAERIRSIFEEAQGGCVLLDDAHELLALDADDDDGGREVFRLLLAEMANHHQAVVVILAGLPAPMAKLLRGEPAAFAQFPNHVRVDNFTPAELVDLTTCMAAQSGHHLVEDLAPRLLKFVEDKYGDVLEEAGNAHLAKSLLLEAKNNASLRIFNLQMQQ
eukprot:gene31312-39352_t